MTDEVDQTAEPVQAEPLPGEDILPLGAWKPEVHQALVNLLLDHGANSPDYDPERPPLAVFDCDETLIHNDIGEAMLRFMISRRRLKTDRGFWHIVPDRLGRDAIMAAYKAVAGRSDNEVDDTAAYRRYRAGLIGVYESIRENEGYEAAYTFAARLLKGLHERTVAELVEQVLDHELVRQLGSEEIAPGPPFQGMMMPAGIRVHQEMLELMQALNNYGFDTWIVSASNAYIVRALARRIGHPEERVIGIELHTQGGSYTDRVVEPVPIGEGKLELFLDTVGRSPVLMVGDSMNDFEMLENCEGVSIVIDRGDEELVENAHKLDWLVQGPLTIG